MHFLVLDKPFIMAKGLIAFSTSVGLFYCMNRLVSYQVGRPAETFDTYVTFVGPVARVNSLMFIQMSVSVEGFLTLTTFVRLLSTVNPLVAL